MKTKPASSSKPQNPPQKSGGKATPCNPKGAKSSSAKMPKTKGAK